MRLEKIKLAGFKSFVDPTTVHMPSNLVGVVGPNGCGKSNVIDAVRWVMGESSAKMLRGESMADVIFNGSTSRKPVGTASIELMFDNSEGRASGQYANYHQIAVKRTVSRDGQSNYFLNGVRCRRRDITDLFLGTGLGPRSYSIIEQGMISRLIEARPEDLRHFLEEAAGISKYKERRRETENRIQGTRENLDRLNDLREEVGKQLQHLQRQAETAEKYKGYKQEERRRKAELLALRWRLLAEEVGSDEGLLARQETALEAALAEQRRLEADIERDRDAHIQVGDRFNEEQSRFYAVGAEISRLEQSIQFARDNRTRQERDLAQLDAGLRELQDHRAQDEAGLEEIAQRLFMEEPELETLREMEEEIAARLQGSEGELLAWQAEWDEFNRKAAEPAQRAQVERTRINHFDQQDVQSQQRQGRLQEELARLQTAELEEAAADLAMQEAEAGEFCAGHEAALQSILGEIEPSRARIKQAEGDLNQVQGRIQELRGRRASLEALQQAALGKQADRTRAWLRDQGLDRAKRLGEVLQVEPAWRGAVEAVLGARLQAVCVDDLSGRGAAVAQLDKTLLALLESEQAPPANLPGDSLVHKIERPAGIATLLAGLRCCGSLAQALGRRAELAPHECWVCPEGVQVGPNWLITGENDTGAGVLKREEELRELAEALDSQESAAEELAEALEQAREASRGLEQLREQRQREFNEANRRLSESRAALSGVKARMEHLATRRRHVEQEIQEIGQQIASGREQQAEARERLHEALTAMETLAQRRESLVARRDQLRDRVEQVRRERNESRAKAHEVALRVEAMRTSRRSLEQSLSRSASQLQQLQGRKAELEKQLGEGEVPVQTLREELETQLAQRLTVEARLGETRNALETLDRQLRQLEQQRAVAEQQAQRRRSELEQGRLKLQEHRVRWSTLEEQLAETGFDRELLLREMPAEAGQEKWQEELQRIARRIEGLGRINLAAIDEYREQAERMKYLDDQHADISRALEVLEEAIRKIDRETRTRFKETFDQVNAGLQTLFPKLFGGGHAYLQLTGEDLLDTGVSVMARPPGKRNSSIQLLSGGEKALTAVALVFAIFQLNPAPFCLLDEVDAPLDDANVGRFCHMVREMSDKVQFIFITHNKVTMEMSNQLIGVTMNEPGVSRIVSVDVGEAAKLVANLTAPSSHPSPPSLEAM
ncbi:MAG: chromosome segregation protein SMC [Gammaproteobacteria bacterium]|nr:chromosome segregation protein SMC [Gammaproteobacteria bacterium]MBU1654098.1 chromosome segregation protein SMC [Gammaproteobacteria bacterium]MBU1961685.1 chromosome segregation protein SMC [Gammaproteobacteria bacterium]